jgi:hypothetical protein
MRSNIFILAIIVILSSCTDCTGDGSSGPCYKGRAIMFSCCTGTTFFEMSTSVALGKDIEVGGITYHNAIQVVGRFEGEMSMQFREYDPQKDQNKIGPVCYCLMAEPWVSLPMFVLESSGSDCSIAE